MRAWKSMTAAVLAAGGLAFSSAGSAQNEDLTVYLGASIGQSNYDGFCSSVLPGVACEDTDTAMRIFGGFQINKHFAIELGYFQMGEAKATPPGNIGSLTMEATGFEVDAVGMLPLGEKFSIFGKVGFYTADTKVSVPGASTTPSRDDLTYGVGVKFDFTKNLGVRAEWQRYQDLSTFDLLGQTIFSGDVDVMSIGVVWTFR